MVKVPHYKFCDQWFNPFFCSSKIQMIIYHRDGRSDTHSGLYRIFQYKGIESVRVFLHFESGSGILCLGSDILGRFRILNFEEKINKIFIV